MVMVTRSISLLHTTGLRYGGLSLLARLTEWAALRRQRARLADLPDHLLDDIGVSREEALREASGRAWSAPTHWVR